MSASFILKKSLNSISQLITLSVGGGPVPRVGPVREWPGTGGDGSGDDPLPEYTYNYIECDVSRISISDYSVARPTQYSCSTLSPVRIFKIKNNYVLTVLFY